MKSSAIWKVEPYEEVSIKNIFLYLSGVHKETEFTVLYSPYKQIYDEFGELGTARINKIDRASNKVELIVETRKKDKRAKKFLQRLKGDLFLKAIIMFSPKDNKVIGIQYFFIDVPRIKNVEEPDEQRGSG